MNLSTIQLFSGSALFVIFACSTFMTLSRRVKDGVMLKFSLICLAGTSALAFLTRLRGVEFLELDMLVLVSTATTAVIMMARVVNGTSTFISDEL
jgi:hypothetical protein